MSAGWTSPRRLVGMALPMAVWALHLVVVYSLAGLACTRGWDRRVAAGLPLVGWWMLAATVVALLLIAALGVRALRRWRLAVAATTAADTRGNGRTDSPPAPADAVDAAAHARRHRFTAGAAAVLALLAAVAVLFTAAPLPLLPLCGT